MTENKGHPRQAHHHESDVKGFKCQMRKPQCMELEIVDLKALAALHGTKQSFLSFYMDFGHIDIKNFQDDRYVRKRVFEIENALSSDHELKRCFQKGLELVETIVKTSEFHKNTMQGVAEGVVFFVDMEKMDVYYFFLPRGVTNLMVVDSSPYIKPLAMLLEEWEDSLIIFIDVNHAAIYHVNFTRIHTERTFKKDIFHHHKKGGWSQMRYQRIRDGALKHFYKEVAETIEKILQEEKIERIFIAGPGDIKKNFADELSKATQEKVISYMEVDNDTGMRELWEMSLPLFFKEEEKEEQELVEELRGQVLKGGLAAYGIDEVIEATTSGRAELILLSPGKRIPGFKCEACGVLKKTSSSCPLCGKTMNGVDLTEELVELAQQMGTKLEFIKKAELLDELGGVAAFLRY